MSLPPWSLETPRGDFVEGLNRRHLVNVIVNGAELSIRSRTIMKTPLCVFEYARRHSTRSRRLAAKRARRSCLACGNAQHATGILRLSAIYHCQRLPSHLVKRFEKRSSIPYRLTRKHSIRVQSPRTFQLGLVSKELCDSNVSPGECNVRACCLE
jgi:hypothetical protein